MSELDALRERVVALERENDELRTPKRRRIRGRSVIGAVLLVLAVVLAPVAAMGTWARLQLVETESFVATFAPLASDPDVQDFVAEQVSAAIDEQVDVSAVVGEVFDGIRSLGLPPRADTALTLLEGPAADGAISLIDGVVHDVVRSEQFADIWTQSLRFTHDRATAILQNAPGTAVQLSDDGAVTIELGVVIERVKQAMSERGIGLADVIPEIDRSIPIAQADSLALVRTVYQVADIGGFWLPWLVVALVVAGVLLMRDRPRAVLWSSAAIALVFLLLSAGLGIGRGVFLRAVSPEIMSAAAATALFEQLTSLLAGTIAAIALIGVLAAMWAWLAGSSRAAAGFRGLVDSGFSAVRGAAERRGLTTGAFGRGIDRFRGPIFIAAVVVVTVLLIASRPVSFGSVIGAGVGLLVVAVLVELLRRPSEPKEMDVDPSADAATSTAQDPVSAPDAVS
ncbi:hypothetical protein [Microbacterium sp. NPDC087589]|uniref:hypothetical protein n=1 Tax=Microbacterium sp. NPDC087589 TaxID=3364191 RepID=UPI0037F8C0BE